MPPARPQFDKLTRNILASKPRVTRFKINWDDANGSTNGDMNLEEASTNAFFSNNDGNMDQDDNNEDIVNGSGERVPVDARLNENSNSLAMEC